MLYSRSFAQLIKSLIHIEHPVAVLSTEWIEVSRLGEEFSWTGTLVVSEGSLFSLC
jgi:hypothetical protein